MAQDAQKVVNITDIRSQEKTTGQEQLFEGVEEFAPGFKEWAGMMDQMLHQTQKENTQLRHDMQENTAQSRRLANSLEGIIPQIAQQSVDQSAPHIVFGHLAEGQEADVAIADGLSVPAEALYTLTAGELADRMGNKNMSATRMGALLRELKIFGDSKFHHTLRTSRKGICQKYKLSVIDEIYKRLQSPDKFNIPQNVVAKYIDFIKPKEALCK